MRLRVESSFFRAPPAKDAASGVDIFFSHFPQTFRQTLQCARRTNVVYFCIASAFCVSLRAGQRQPATDPADASRQSHRTHRSRRRSNPPRRQDIRNPARLRGIQGLVGVPRREDGAGRDAAAGLGARNTRGARHRHQRRQPDPHGGMGLPQFSPHHALLLVHPRLPRTAPARARSRQMALQGRPPLRPTCSSTKPPDGSPRTTSSPSTGSPPTKESCRTSASDSQSPLSPNRRPGSILSIN